MHQVEAELLGGQPHAAIKELAPLSTARGQPQNGKENCNQRDRVMNSFKGANLEPVCGASRVHLPLSSGRRRGQAGPWPWEPCPGRYGPRGWRRGGHSHSHTPGLAAGDCLTWETRPLPTHARRCLLWREGWQLLGLSLCQAAAHLSLSAGGAWNCPTVLPAMSEWSWATREA